MNLNYVGSVAERFMKFRSTLSTTEDVSENLFNALSIYVPKSLAEASLESEAYDPTEVTATKYAVIQVTVDNYTSVLKSDGALMSQWLPVFNDGTNTAVTMYIIVFDDTDFAPTVTATGISWEPLTKAFKDLYFISLFKVMFSSDYSGVTDVNYFDRALCFAQLCEQESTLTFNFCEVHVTVPESGATDTNACKVMTLTKAEETEHCTTLASSDVTDRAKYFWGFLNLIGSKHTEMYVHNGSIMTPIILGRWFEETNASGEYVGNKLAKIRLSGDKVKPTGLPSPLNSDVNLNLEEAIYTVLDEKNVGYFISISSSSLNNAELVRDRSISNYPATAYAIAKWIDYNASQALAEYASKVASSTEPVLANEQTYLYIQSLVQSTINTFGTLGRITNVSLNFPLFSQAKVGNTFTGTAVWKATYIDDLEGVSLTGSISF